MEAVVLAPNSSNNTIQPSRIWLKFWLLGSSAAAPQIEPMRWPIQDIRALLFLWEIWPLEFVFGYQNKLDSKLCLVDWFLGWCMAKFIKKPLWIFGLKIIVPILCYSISTTASEFCLQNCEGKQYSAFYNYAAPEWNLRNSLFGNKFMALLYLIFFGTQSSIRPPIFVDNSR